MTGSSLGSPTVRRRPRHLRSPSPYGVLAAAAATLTASLALLMANSPKAASAYSQAYNCETFVGHATCDLTAGSWHNITNVGARNYDVAGDICAQYGQLSSTLQCVYSGYQVLLCNYSSPVYEYGISKTRLGDADNISGHEDDSTTCS